MGVIEVIGYVRAGWKIEISDELHSSHYFSALLPSKKIQISIVPF